jgi:ABC-type transport system involved in multi-copper enzyme maturation permease subunit
VLAVCAFLGAVGPTEILWSAIASLSSAALAGAYAVGFAAGSRSNGGIALLACAAYGFHALFGLGIPPWSSIVHPLTAATAGLQADAYRLSLTPLATALFVLFLLRIAGARLASPEALLPLPVKTSKDIEARDSYATVAMRNLGLRRVDRPVFENYPLLWKEIKTRGAAQLAPELRLFVLIMLGLLTLMALLNGWGAVFFFVMLLVLFVVAIAAGASLFSRDREGRRWETLFVTPVRAQDVITAKLLSLPFSSEGLVLAAETAVASILYFQTFHQGASVPGVLGSMIFLAFAYVCAAACSLRIRTPRRALAIATLIPTLILFLVPWLDKVRLGTRADRTIAFSYWIHPFWQFDTSEFTLGFVVYAGIYLTAVALLIGGMIRRFDRSARSG